MATIPNEQCRAIATYSKQQLGWELERTALGEGYYGEALRLAKRLCLTHEDLSVLERFEKGTQRSTDHVRLQAIANKVSTWEASTRAEPAAEPLESGQPTRLQALEAAARLVLAELEAIRGSLATSGQSDARVEALQRVLRAALAVPHGSPA